MTAIGRRRSLRARFHTKPKQILEADPLRILAVSGGGYRGLYSAEVLRRIECELQPETAQDVKSPKAVLCDRFDLFAGTSAGGLIAAGLAIGRSAHDLQEAMLEHGPRIFDDRYKFRGRNLGIRKPKGNLGGLISAKFDSKALKDAIDDVLGDSKSMTVGAVPRPIILIATCATTRAPYIMTNLGRDGLNSGMELKTALVATAAAPSYFPAVDMPAELPTRTLVDGGLVANAPDLVALSMLLRETSLAKKVRVLSIGTAGSDAGVVPETIGRRGLFRWLTGDLVPLTLEAQERLVIQVATDLLGKDYWRLNAPPSPNQSRVLALDRATQNATRTLLHLAEQTASRWDTRKLKEWLAAPVGRSR